MPISLHTDKIVSEKNCFIEELYGMISNKEELINGEISNSATQLHKLYLTLYIMNHYDKKQHISEYMNYLMTCVIESESLFVMGFTNAAMMSLRGSLEISFKFLYYEYHPIELELNEMGKHDITGMDYRSFMYSIPSFQKLNFIKRDEIERIWSELCQYVHCDFNVINDISIISDIKPVLKDSSSFANISKKIKEIFRIIIIIMFISNSKWLEEVEKSYFDYIFEILFNNEEAIKMKIALKIV